MNNRCTVLLCGLSLIVVLGGCGKKKEVAVQEKKAITIWWAQWAPADGLQELGNEFEKATGIVVKVHQIPWMSYQDQVFLNFGNKQTDFDIVVGDSQWIGRGATKGLYLELTDWLPQAIDMNTVHPRAAKYLCEYPSGSGRFYAAPCETDAAGFAYRRDWFDDPAEKAAFKQRYGRDLTVPDTWEEFRDVAEFFSRPNEKRYGCVLLTGRGYDALTMGYQQIMWAFGGSWGDEKTFKVNGYANNAGAVEALKFMKGLLAFAPPGATNADYSKALEAFTNGSTAMSMNYFAFYPSIVKQMGERAGFFMVPRHGETRVISLGGQGFSISTKIPASQQELARQFIAWFLKTEVQKKWITKDAGFTANTAILSSEEFKNATPYNGPFAASLDHLRDFWNVPVYNELLAVAQRYIGEALDDVQPPQEALNHLAEEHEKIFREAGFLKE
jgi:multiple sugar transport system substrate-binding protein